MIRTVVTKSSFDGRFLEFRYRGDQGGETTMELPILRGRHVDRRRLSGLTIDDAIELTGVDGETEAALWGIGKIKSLYLLKDRRRIPLYIM